jgi:dolichol-phosphate mannosyltransferase
VRSIVVLPTYNEVENIDAYFDALRAVSSSIEVVVVDDDSPDGTGDAVQRRAETDTGIHLMSRTAKEGLGAAYRAGFGAVLRGEYGPADVVVSMDADLSHDPAVLPAMLARIEEGADVVVGSRYVEGGGTDNWPIHRRLLSSYGNSYTRLALGIGVHDCTSGYRAYRATALRSIEPQSTAAEGYAFLTELIRRADHAGFAIVETPILFSDRTHGTSKMSARIIVESMWRVTVWAVGSRWRRFRGRA